MVFGLITYEKTLLKYLMIFRISPEMGVIFYWFYWFVTLIKFYCIPKTKIVKNLLLQCTFTMHGPRDTA